LSDHREALLAAAAALAAEKGLGRFKYAEAVDRSHVPRATAYRIFSGVDAMLMALHEELIETTVQEIRASVRSDKQPITFRAALECGFAAVVDAFRQSRLTKGFLSTNPELLSLWLLSRADGSLYDVFWRFVSKCGASFGSLEFDLDVAAQTFVRGVLVDFEADLHRSGSAWPDRNQLRELLMPRIKTLLKDAKLARRDGEARLEGAIVPLAGVPETFSMPVLMWAEKAG